MRPSVLLDTLPRPAAGSPYRIVFVCTGNICRSPMAEVVTTSIAGRTKLADGSLLGDRMIATSAGTGPWHQGEPMDPRAVEALERAGYVEYAHVAQQVSAELLRQSDLVVALDRRHQETLHSLGIPNSDLVLLRLFDPSASTEPDVPDPYYGDDDEFDHSLAVIVDGCRGLVSHIAKLWDVVLSP